MLSKQLFYDKLKADNQKGVLPLDTIVATLQRCKLFQGVEPSLLEQYLLPRGTVAEYPAGSTVFFPQDRVDDVRVLLSGKMKLVYFLENGSQDIRNILFSPSAVGLDLVCTPTRRSPYQAVAVEKSVLFVFPARLLLSPGVLPEPDRLTCLNNLLTILSQINMQKEYRLAILTRHSLRERIMVYLTMQAMRRQTSTFRIPFSREEMAAFLSVNRSALSHELSLLKQEGLIDFRKNTFTLRKWLEDADCAAFFGPREP